VAGILGGNDIHRRQDGACAWRHIL
jgi:hypothetical protein